MADQPKFAVGDYVYFDFRYSYGVRSQLCRVLVEKTNRAGERVYRCRQVDAGFELTLGEVTLTPEPAVDRLARLADG